jgi:predicted RNA-binding protein with PIN domain
MMWMVVDNFASDERCVVWRRTAVDETQRGAYNIRAMHWMVDGYNVIRRDPSLASQEAVSLEAGRAALCRLLARTAKASGEKFTVVFDGAGDGGIAGGRTAVTVVFSSARETADRVLARLAVRGGAVVSNDREVRRAAERAGAIAVTTDQFLARIQTLAGAGAPTGAGDEIGAPSSMKDEEGDDPEPPRKGNPRRLPRKRRAASRALGRLRRLT